MGNETSQQLDLKLNSKAIEASDFWIHYSAVLNKLDEANNELSVFICEDYQRSLVWEDSTPLEKYARNLMIYRHPSILKYISFWNKGSKTYLVVEPVRPLSQELSLQSTLQVCIGLHSILKALVFLNDKALSSHNNICLSSIYVTQDGCWKLAGLEFLCKYTHLTQEYLTKLRPYRNDKVIDPNENKFTKENLTEHSVVDQYAFGVLVEEILKTRLNDDIQYLKLFYDVCKNDLTDIDITKRPKLQLLLQHPFFDHDFISIYSFLTEIPIKTDPEKAQFFSTLIEKLRQFPEQTVAENLSGLLLSRLVLLDSTARRDVIPILLNPKKGADETHQSLFSIPVFKQHFVQKILKIFRVTDIQIRELLLTHFKSYVNYFTKDELTHYILPELLLGIKDINDNLVSMTLRSLADLVPILGAATVIGGKRAKLFSDGRPTTQFRNFTKSKLPDQINLMNQEINITNSHSEIDMSLSLCLPERPSPDGGEDSSSSAINDSMVHLSNVDDLDWSDWDAQESTNPNLETPFSPDCTLTSDIPVEEDISETSNNYITEVERKIIENDNLESSVSKDRKRSIAVDISEFDIKSQNVKSVRDEFDFFQDMEPVIQSATKLLIDTENSVENLVDGNSQVSINKFTLEVNEFSTPEAGWDDEFNEWNSETNDEISLT